MGTQYDPKAWNEHWTHFTELSPNPNAPHRQALLTMIQKVNPVSILDVGCCDGRLVHILKSIEYRGKYTGVDSAPRFIKLASKTYPNNNFLVMDCTDLRFPDNSFDLVVLSMVICHLDEERKRKTIQECLRVGEALCVFTFLSKGEASYRNDTKLFINEYLCPRDFCSLFEFEVEDLWLGVDGSDDSNREKVIGGLITKTHPKGVRKT